jgi:hypothetical protein
VTYPHMPAGTLPPDTGGDQTFSVRYTALGTEPTTGFYVPIGKTMANTNYGISYRSAGGTSGSDGKQSSGVQLFDIPATEQQLGQFWIVPSVQLGAGDVLEFTIDGVVS